MKWLLTAAISAALVELIVRIPLLKVAHQISRVSYKALRVLASKSIPDHRKEKATLAYARVLFLSTMKLSGLLIFVGLVLALNIHFMSYLDSGFSDFLVSFSGSAFSVAVSIFYVLVRRRIG